MERYWDKFDVMDVEAEKVLKVKMTKLVLDEILETTKYDCDVRFVDGLTMKVDIYLNESKNKENKKKQRSNVLAATFEFGNDYDIDVLSNFYSYVRHEFKHIKLKPGGVGRPRKEVS